MFDDDGCDDEFLMSTFRRRASRVETISLPVPRLEVPAGASCEGYFAPDVVFRADTMVLVEASRGLRVSIHVAHERQCVGMPAELYIPRWVEAKLTERDLAVLAAEDFLSRLVLVMPLRLKTCSPANRMVFFIENPTDKTCVFDGALFGVTVR